MFYCNDCGQYMDEIEALCFIPEVHTELENKPTEWIGQQRCIYCGSDNLEEARYCEGCGELYPESMIDENDLCDECRFKAETEEDEE